MARARSIIVGGGLGTVGALAVGAFTYISTTIPPAVQISSMLGQGANGVVIAAGRVDPQAAATEVLHVKGGAIIEGAGDDSVVIGRAAASAHTDTVVVGQGASSSANNAVIIGLNASGGGISIGSGAATPSTGYINIGGTINGSAGTSTAVVIGGVHTTQGSNSCVVVGGGAISNGSANTVLGSASTTNDSDGVTLVGMQATSVTLLTNVTAIGALAAGNRSGQIVLGGTIFSQQVNELRLGDETIAAPAAFIIRRANASGADNAAGALTVQGALSTGNVAPGKVILSLGKRVAGSSAVLQTAYNHVTLDNDTTDVFAVFDAPTGNSSRIHLAINSVTHAVIGAAGAVNGIVTGSAVGEVVVRSIGTRVLFTTDGVTVPLYINAAGTSTVVNKDRGLRFDNHTSSAGAQAGTLGNAPAAGNPTHWLKVSIGGVNFAIPCWPG